MSEMGNLIEDPHSGLSYRMRAASASPSAPTAPSPRLLLLHGVGSNEQDMGRLPEFIRPEIEVLSVRAPNTLGPHQYAWFQVQFGANGPTINARQAEESRVRLITLLTHLTPAGGTGGASPSNGQKTVIAGFSQGGIMSAGVGLTAPTVVDGFGILSGRILPEITPLIGNPDTLGHLNAFIAHGHFDNKLPPVWAQRADKLLSELRVPHRTEYYPIAHELNHQVIEHFTQWLDEPLGLSK